MALQDMTPADLAAVVGNNEDGGWGNGNGWWIILLFMFLGWGNRGWGGGGSGGAGDAGGDMLYPWMNQAQNTWMGFSQIQQDLCNGFAGVTAAVNNGFAQSEIADNARQIADMQQMFGLSQQFADCCCKNQLGLASLGADIAREACADRAAVSDGVRDILANQNNNTQRVLDKLCALELEEARRETLAERRENDQLRQQISGLQLAASQLAQDGRIIDGLYNRLSTCPVGTVPVYGEQPIFTCNNGCGCNRF